MATALTLIVLGHVFNNMTVMSRNGSTIDSGPNVKEVLPDQLLELQTKRYNYTYTPGIGAHKFHTQKANWNTARKICKEEGGHLAIINSVAESELLGRLLRLSEPYVTGSISSLAHIGFHELYATNEWTTIHDESLTSAGFSVWGSGEPNRLSNNEHCGSIYRDGKLNDVSCNWEMNFICELPNVSLGNIVELSPQSRL